MNLGFRSSKKDRTVIIGGGPAGLTAAYELTRHHFQPLVLEKLDKVGGIARTENFNGYHFDMGGHRFYTKSEKVQQFWDEILGDSFLTCPRLSRIFYKNKFFNYPLKPLNAFLGLGPFEGALIALSYLRWQLFPYREEETFEQWVTNRFGKRLFETFFKSYTEKVWGISCSELKAEWAAQRIKDLSLKTAVLNMFFKPQHVIKTLIEEFQYPSQGPGMLWTAVKDKVESNGGEVCLNTQVVRLHREEFKIIGVDIIKDGQTYHINGDQFISSMPVSHLLQWLQPPPPPHILEAAKQLKHRDFLTVCLIIKRESLFPDNWIYIHDPNVKVGRIQNYKNWSQSMVPDQQTTSLGMEYFCNEGDDLWRLSDSELIQLAKKEAAQIGLADEADFLNGCVFRVEKTYPVYDSGYEQALTTIKSYMKQFENLQTIGRNGLHRYNNQDHAMLTGMLAVKNILFPTENNDVWEVNAENEYLEEIQSDPPLNQEELVGTVKGSLGYVFPKVDPTALGLSFGLFCSVFLVALTLTFTTLADEGLKSYLALLNQYFPGYSVTPAGSVIGAVYGLLTGFLLGWLFAFLRNTLTALYINTTWRSAQRNALSQFFDRI